MMQVEGGFRRTMILKCHECRKEIGPSDAIYTVLPRTVHEANFHVKCYHDKKAYYDSKFKSVTDAYVRSKQS